MTTTAALLIATSPSREGLLLAALTAAGWQAEAATSPSQALERMKNTPFSAVFCDAQIRGASPAGFLTWTRRLLPGAAFYLFGPANEWRSSGRPDSFLSFPPIRAELPLAPGTLTVEEPQADDGVPLSGSTALVSLPQLLDMVSASKRAAVVRLHGARGHVHVEGGIVLHASHHEAGSVTTGISALAELLALTDTDFALEDFRRPPRSTINLPVTAAIAEAARLADEQMRDRATVQWLLAEQPRLESIAVGYHLAAAPTAGHGNAQELFTTALALADAIKPRLGNQPRSFSAAADRRSLAVRMQGQGRVIAVSVPGLAGAALLRLVEKAAAAGPE